MKLAFIPALMLVLSACQSTRKPDPAAPLPPNAAEAEQPSIESTMPATRVNDADGDNVPDENDRCPEVGEDLDGQSDGDGCPDLDNDGDSKPDIVDACPDLGPSCPRSR